jgi:hypothetical protein
MKISKSLRIISVFIIYEIFQRHNRSPRPEASDGGQFRSPLGLLIQGGV